MTLEPASAEEASVLVANERFYQAFNQKDFDAMDHVWARETPVVCVHPGWNVLVGRQPVLDSWQGILGNPAQPRIVVGGATVTIVGETAVVVCREFVAGTPLAATNLFVREDGNWRIFHHHSGPVSWTET